MQRLASLISCVVLLTGVGALTLGDWWHGGHVVPGAGASTTISLREVSLVLRPQEPQEPADPEVLTEQEAIDFYNRQVQPILKKHCYECHADDPEELEGSFAVTSHASILRGGDSGPAIDPDQLKESIFLKAINYDIYEMPPSGKLSDPEIATLTRWVKLGLPFDPSTERDLTAAREGQHGAPLVNEETRKWWSFQPVQRPQPPSVQQADWVRSPIDAFILARLEEVGLHPAPPASREVLVRRAYYDLLGLPPTYDQVQAFLADDAPDAFARLVDQLLESPHYGEKWGRHWLDLVRYAESNSFERDGTKPFVWRYRDYVIRSFNEDKPYDQFLIEQLAGDELPAPSVDALIATGYYRLGTWDDEPADPLLAKYDELDDILATTGQTMMGLTVNCARCHDHKIDPIPQRDYYQLAAMFENIRRMGVRSDESVFDASVRTVPGPATEQQVANYQAELEKLEAEMKAIEDAAKPGFQPVEHEDFQYEMNRLPILRKRVGQEITQKQWDRYRQLTGQRKALLESPPGSIKVLCVKEHADQEPESFVRIRGNPHVTGDPVEPGFISVLSPPEPQIERRPDQPTLGRRLAFAQWLVSPQHPLTARVMANRLWQYHFGRGIVRTPSDFGFQGMPPTHPQLLDWLASELVAQGWSLKQMHRQIMNSSAYQMSSQYNEQAYQLDPGNDRFWRFDLRRLTAEEIRDSILAVSGRLEKDRMFGPSIFPKMPEEVLAGQSRPGLGWGNSSDEDRRRRSIYVHVKRSLKLPILGTNDAADTDTTCPVRFITTQPNQALGMMNSQFTNSEAREFAAVIAALDLADDRARVTEILRRVTQREPTPAEVDRGLKLLQAWQSEDQLSAERAWEYLCLMALNLNEFVYLD